MLAETETAVAWRESKIAMNSVNPDYAVLIRSGWRCREEKARSARSARRMGLERCYGLSLRVKRKVWVFLKHFVSVTATR